jgi:hypothetical protein
MFYDLMSLWTIPIYLSLAKAQTICLANILTNGSGRPFEEDFNNLYKSPP